MSKFERFQRLVVIFLVAVGFFYGGYYYGKRGFVFELKRNPPSINILNRYPGDQEVDFALFWEVWDLVEQNYLERPVDAQKMVYGAITGMVSSLGDPYTSFMAPKINTVVRNTLNGAYEGIGAELGLRDGILIIVSPFDGSPSKEAGLMPGDKILKIEDESTLGMTIQDAVSLIRGEAGTEIKLTIQTGTNDPRDVLLIRNKINIPSVNWTDYGDGTVYVRVSRFGEKTNDDWTRAVQEINVEAEELDALILDLRGNPGGYMQSAVHIAGEFFRNEPVLYQEEATGEQTPFRTTRMGNFIELPKVFVLIDGGSASASEILAGALRAHVDATLVGTKSFGKGTIQEPKEFEDGSGLHITVAKWLTPDKIWVHNNGLEPDVQVEITEENIQNNEDPQLDKAIELANEY